MNILTKISQYRFNGSATLLLIILSANAIIFFIFVNFFIALIQIFFTITIAALGAKAEIWKKET